MYNSLSNIADNHIKDGKIGPYDLLSTITPGT